MKDTQEYRVGTGASLMLMIVVVLMLAVMGMLALSAAQAGRRQTDQNIRTVTDTYEADAAAERALARIDALRRDAQDLQAFRDQVLEMQTDGLEISWFSEDELELVLGIDGQRQLRATLRIGQGAIDVAAWRVERTDEWETEDGLELFDGTAF